MTDEQIIKLAEEHLVPVYEGVSGRLYHSNPPCDDATDSVLKFARAILAAEGSAAPAEPAPDQDGIFTVKNGEWRARVRGVLQAAVWDSYESAWAAYAKARYAQPVADSPAPEPLSMSMFANRQDYETARSAQAVQRPVVYYLVDPQGRSRCAEPSQIKAWARLAGYKPTVETLLAYEEQGWRVVTKAATGLERNGSSAGYLE